MDASKRTTRKVLLTVLALGAATSAVVFGSLAAWTAQTTNPDNDVTAGSLSFTNSKNAAAVISSPVGGAYPGDNNGAGETVVITNAGTGSLDAELLIDGVSTNELSDELEVQIHDGTNCIVPAAVGACTGWETWSGLGQTVSLGSFAASAAKTYNVKWRFPDIALGNDPAGQGQTASFDMTWSATST
jgi:predicted ribosomally synthesized peptide with SipW-like signal peptide